MIPGEADEEGDPEYVSPDHTSKGLEFGAIGTLATLFGRAMDPGIAAYCDWSKANGAALVEEFAKRANATSGGA